MRFVATYCLLFHCLKILKYSHVHVLNCFRMNTSRVCKHAETVQKYIGAINIGAREKPFEPAKLRTSAVGSVIQTTYIYVSAGFPWIPLVLPRPNLVISLICVNSNSRLRAARGSGGFQWISVGSVGFGLTYKLSDFCVFLYSSMAT